MSLQTIGTCSLCGGPVQVPTEVWSVLTPVPTCTQCGAVKDDHGPVIKMRPAPKAIITTTTDSTKGTK